jgi:SNF2 family DNA or RNA helicase
MSDTLLSQPENININLFLHQLKSIDDMDRIEREKEIELHPSIYVSTKVGVLADLPGYGKSLSMLGLIGRTLKNPQVEEQCVYVWEKTKYYEYVSLKKTEVLHSTNCSLILVNISLMSQWIHELTRTSLRYIAVHSKYEIEDIPLHNYDVVLVSNNIYNIFSQVYRKKCWKRFIIDEPASLKLPSMEETYARFYWLITGTPNELYGTNKRRTGFLNNLLPEEFDIFNHIIVKNEDQFVKKSYDMPSTKYLFYTYLGNMSHLFEGIVSDTIIEMIQAGNINGVFNMLLDKENKEEKETVYSTTMIDAYRSRKMKRLQELQKEEVRNIEKIQVIESHIKLLDDKIFNYVIKNSCMICKHPHSYPSVITCCQNIFCGLCVKDEECPLCKSKDFSVVALNVKEDLNSSDVVEVVHTNALNAPLKNKIETFIEIIKDVENRKILIFSNYNETFTVIKKFLDEMELSYLELRGTKEKRDNTIDLYKTGNVNILLLNTIHSGAGLNLQETTDIVLFHRIHEYQKVQVIGRANRIGRKIPLNVHYLE